MLLPQLLFAQPTVAPENNVKASYLLLFTRFVEWPASAFTSSNAPIVVGVLGDDSFRGAVEKTLLGQMSDGRTLEIRRVRSLTEAEACHLLFIHRDSDDWNEADWFARLRNKPVLTVGESGRTIERGGVVEFVLEEKRVRFDASWQAMVQAGLKIRSPMLSSARKVHQKPTNKRTP